MTQSPQDRLRIPGVAEVFPDRGGLPALHIHPSDASHGASATIYLHGAHVAAWKPASQDEVLWLSEKSQWQADKPIRGGVPLCFPWFGPNKQNPALPAHGFVRLRPWSLESVDRTPQGITATFMLTGDAATRALWPHDFFILHRVTIGRELAMTLSVHNLGTSPLAFEEAQHTYFSVGDVRQVGIRGLSSTRYLDKVDAAQQKSQSGDITITAETDRVYLDTESPITIEDPLKRRRIVVRKEHSRNTVVWNPWIAKARAMPDFGDEEWPSMLCVETCNVGPSAVTLAPDQTHFMTSQIQVQPL